MDGYAWLESQIYPRPVPNTTSTTSLVPINATWPVGIRPKAEVISNRLAWRGQPHPRSISKETRQRPRSTASHPRAHQNPNRVVGKKNSRVDRSATVSRSAACNATEGDGGSRKRGHQEAIELRRQHSSTAHQWPKRPRYCRFRLKHDLTFSHGNLVG